jgi:hypothetical protein
MAPRHVARFAPADAATGSGSRGQVQVAIFEYFDPIRIVAFLIAYAEISCQSIFATKKSHHTENHGVECQARDGRAVRGQLGCCAPNKSLVADIRKKHAKNSYHIAGQGDGCAGRYEFFIFGMKWCINGMK